MKIYIIVVTGLLHIWISNGNPIEDDVLGEKCLACICQINKCESRDCNSVNGVELCGPFNISERYWTAARDSSTGNDFRSCTTDYDCSLRTVRRYMLLHSRDCSNDGWVDCTDIAKLHFRPEDCKTFQFINLPAYNQFMACYTGNKSALGTPEIDREDSVTTEIFGVTKTQYVAENEVTQLTSTDPSSKESATSTTINTPKDDVTERTIEENTNIPKDDVTERTIEATTNIPKDDVTELTRKESVSTKKTNPAGVIVGNMDLCLQCLCEAMSPCDKNVGCKDVTIGKVCGPFAMSMPYWIDAGRPSIGDSSDHDAFETCAVDFSCSKAAITNYTYTYRRDCNGDGLYDCEDLSRMHLAGPNNCHLAEATYDGKFRKLLDCILG